jgi:hypothetical protein
MKFNSFFLTGLLLISLISCQNKSETSLSEYKTDLKIDIPIETEILNNSKSAESNLKFEYNISGESIYSTSNLNSGTEGLSDIQSVKSAGDPVLMISGVNTDGEVYDLQLNWGYKISESNDYVFQEPIDLLNKANTLNNGVLTINLAESLNSMIANLNPNTGNSIKLVVSGKSDFALSGSAKLEIPLLIESENYSIQFTLF